MNFKHWLLSEALVYHGSPTPFAGFDAKKQTSGYYPGFYMTADDLKDMARAAGFETRAASGSGEVKYLLSLGYHGIQRGVEYIVFKPEATLHLKSV